MLLIENVIHECEWATNSESLKTKQNKQCYRQGVFIESDKTRRGFPIDEKGCEEESSTCWWYVAREVMLHLLAKAIRWIRKVRGRRLWEIGTQAHQKQPSSLGGGINHLFRLITCRLVTVMCPFIIFLTIFTRHHHHHHLHSLTYTKSLTTIININKYKCLPKHPVFCGFACCPFS